MEITSEQVKELRERTGVSVMECKKALVEAGGDLDKAILILKERSLASVVKKAGRELAAGTIAAYVHNTGAVGALVALHCETDFVSKNEEFKTLARDVAMHISAMDPKDTGELMQQQFIKDPSKTIADLISGAVQKFGERIELGNFSRSSIA